MVGTGLYSQSSFQKKMPTGERERTQGETWPPDYEVSSMFRTWQSTGLAHKALGLISRTHYSPHLHTIPTLGRLRRGSEFKVSFHSGLAAVLWLDWGD